MQHSRVCDIRARNIHIYIHTGMHSGMMMGAGGMGGWSSQGVPHCLGGPSDIEYSLDTKKISKGMDKRTTVMIRNIPNKYTQVIMLYMTFH
jgi:hypothetical protein